MSKRLGSNRRRSCRLHQCAPTPTSCVDVTLNRATVSHQGQGHHGHGSCQPFPSRMKQQHVSEFGVDAVAKAAATMSE